MAEANGNSITVPPSIPILGGAKITGAATILAIMLCGAVWWVYSENNKRNQQFELIYQKLDNQDKVRGSQFDRLECKIDMGVYAHSFPKGQIDWSSLPSELYTCFPNFKFK